MEIQSEIEANTVVKRIRDSCLYFYFRFVCNILCDKWIVASVSQPDILSDRLYVESNWTYVVGLYIGTFEMEVEFLESDKLRHIFRLSHHFETT